MTPDDERPEKTEIRPASHTIILWLKVYKAETPAAAVFTSLS